MLCSRLTCTPNQDLVIRTEAWTMPRMTRDLDLDFVMAAVAGMQSITEMTELKPIPAAATADATASGPKSSAAGMEQRGCGPTSARCFGVRAEWASASRISAVQGP